MPKKLFIMFTSLFLMVFVFTVSVSASKPDIFADYEDNDGNVQYGWHLEANDINVKTWYFDENGNPSGAYAAEGDTSEQFTNNYAIRNLLIGSQDSYSMQATFTPDPETDVSVDRAYGLLLWYQNSQNFLIYWLQQKWDGPAWSGQFYGRVNGVWKEIYLPQEFNNLGNIGDGYSDSWRRFEWTDMWWDSNHAHPALRGNRKALLTNSVTIKVNSDVESVTVGGVTEENRYFEIYQIVDEQSYQTAKFYVKNIASTDDGFYTGLYSEKFNVDISDYKLECETDFSGAVEEKITQLPSQITTDEELNNVLSVVKEYKALLAFQEQLSADNISKIEALDAAIVPYVDGRILGLDENKSTFLDDVDAVDNLFNNLPISYQDQVTELDALLEAIEKAVDWEDPTLVKPEITITTPETANVGDEIEVKYTVSDNLTSADDLIVEVQVKKGPTTAVQLTNNKFVAEEGKYTIKVTAKDEHGNTASATLVVDVVVADTEKPTVEITTPATANVGDEVEVKYTATDNISQGSDLEVLVSVSKDGSPVQLNNNKFTAETGTYTITVTVRDAAGNISTASTDVVVGSSDTEKPVVKITTPTTASVGEEVLVTYTATDDTSAANKMTAVVKVTKDGQEVVVTNNKFTAEQGNYEITVTVTDEAGNTTVATSTVSVGVTSAAPKKGCGGSVIASILGVLSLGAVAFAFGRKRKEF